jgi:hypothetical protein
MPKGSGGPYLPPDAIVKVPSEDPEYVNPVKYSNIYKKWIDGTSMYHIASEHNLTMKEFEYALRQAVIEEVARAGRKRKAKKKN